MMTDVRPTPAQPHSFFHKILIIDKNQFRAAGLVSLLSPATYLHYPGVQDMTCIMASIRDTAPDAVFIECCGTGGLLMVNELIFRLHGKALPVYVLLDDTTLSPNDPRLPAQAIPLPRNMTPGALSRRIQAGTGGNYTGSRPALRLTPAEKKVLKGLMRGLTQTQIASVSNRSLKTICSQKRGAMKRLGLCSHTRLLSLLIELKGCRILD